LLRDPHARRDEGEFVVEGPRLVAAALDHRAPLATLYVAVDASEPVAALARRARGAGVAVEYLAPGVADRIGSTVTPQGVFGVVRIEPARPNALRDATFVVVVDRVNDPGNAGTLWRSATAAGADLFVLGAGSVDAYNPKLVRATAGACFSVPVLDDADVATVLEECGANGLLRAGAVVRDGTPVVDVDFTQPCAIVIGHESQGLPEDLPLDVPVTIPMAGTAESLNLAMAGTVLCFEVARQRRDASP
jgi:RNA methyltransferase, TrmH family